MGGDNGVGGINGVGITGSEGLIFNQYRFRYWLKINPSDPFAEKLIPPTPLLPSDPCC